VTLLTFRQAAVAALLGCVLAAGVPTPADAQIYAWRDSEGRLVLSDRPLPLADIAAASGIRTFAAREASMVRSTRPVLNARAADYEPLIARHASDHGIRPDLVRAVIQTESAFNPFARSVKGALGLMQLMPETARELGVLDPFDPTQNIRGGVQYLRRLLDRYANNEVLALAAYNAGPGAVDRYGTVPPYRETRDYVQRVQGRTSLVTRSRRTKIYRSVEVIDGREVPRYTNQRPSGR